MKRLVVIVFALIAVSTFAETARAGFELDASDSVRLRLRIGGNARRRAYPARYGYGGGYGYGGYGNAYGAGYGFGMGYGYGGAYGYGAAPYELPYGYRSPAFEFEGGYCPTCIVPRMTYSVPAFPVYQPRRYRIVSEVYEQ
jgi:hypothetical protein